MWKLRSTLTFFILSLAIPSFVFAQQFTAAQTDFFENNIRPLLADHCLECHGPDEPENGLRLDSREAILAGGDSGEPAVIPGNSKESLLMRSVRHEGDYDMPPNDQLSDQQINALAAWIEMGMPWPSDSARIGKATMEELMKRHRASHWSFQPINSPAIPEVRRRATAKTDLDKLILAKLESRGLQFSPLADRRTLIRRATYDLTGLPPSPEEVDAFVANDDPDSFAKLIDRLLESPQYGERWARHWLDVARYADTRGYTLANADRSYPFAFTYRDYVIKALNDDLPYDQFVKEQLAADYLDLPETKEPLAALGFITVGRKYLDRPSTVDDQVDVVTRGLMGLTVSCARCHDHKYDAIPTKDYYSLYGVFENCHEPEELPLIGDTENVADAAAYFEQMDAIKNEVKGFEDQVHARIQNQFNENIADYVVRALGDIELEPSDCDALNLQSHQVNKQLVFRLRNYLASNAESPGLKPLTILFGLTDEQLAATSQRLADEWSKADSQLAINPRLLDRLIAKPPQDKIEIGMVLADVLTEIRDEWLAAGSKQPPLDQFNDSDKHLARIILSQNSAATVKRSQITKYFGRKDREDYRKLKDKLKKLDAESPPGIRRAMTIRENESPYDVGVFLRGNPATRGEVVPRQFVALIDEDRQPFKQRAGRLELAEAIVSPDNPLTARVIVNRIWMHHFSVPLVETPSDFGIRCPQPVQQDVLDYLANDLMQNGWSIKRLHRNIMLSRAYKQRSDDSESGVAKDPENRLLWKMNRRRLEFEALRDSMLQVSGELNPTLYGPALELFSGEGRQRRTIYAKIDRQDLTSLLRVFDFANPDQSAAKRIRTTVPQQSLFMINHEFAIEQAKLLAARVQDSESNEQKIEQLYRIVYQRSPKKRELNIACNFLKRPEPEGQLTRLQQLAQTLLCTNEFEFID